METLRLDVPLRVKEPEVLLDPQLRPGTYRVELIVEGRSGRSAPVYLLIKVFKE